VPRPSPARVILAREGIGVSAHILQGRGLEILRAHVDYPALILVDRGIKAVRAEGNATVKATPGQAIVLRGNQTVDFTNSVREGMHYEARWLLFDLSLLDDPYYAGRAATVHPEDRSPPPARLLAHVSHGLATAFESARQALAASSEVPDAVTRQRMLEVMHWLLEERIALHSAPVNPTVSIKVRALLAGRLDADWKADRVAKAMAMSEATLRRRLAEEETSLTELLVEMRMSSALTLLQATAQPVSDIALSVGYQSPSRFAIRFRQRFGFAPTAVRGHERAN
jgi:AraC-like DNA-binding protein